MLFLWLWSHRELSKIARGISFNLSRSEFELSNRYNGLEKLLHHNPDILTKEIIYGFYFPFDELMKHIEGALREIIARHLEYLLVKGGKPWINSRGFLSSRARKFILEKLDFLPLPFYRRVKHRIRYLQIDMRSLQDDYLKLEQIVSALSDKGYIISGKPKPYYHHIDFQDVMSKYSERRFAENYVQTILMEMNVLKLTIQSNISNESIRPIAQDKRLAQLRKTFTLYINNHAPQLALEKKHEFIQILLDRGIDELNGKRAIEELSELLHRIPFQEAKEQVMSQNYLKLLPDKLLSNRFEIGPEGLQLKE